MLNIVNNVFLLFSFFFFNLTKEAGTHEGSQPWEALQEWKASIKEKLKFAPTKRGINDRTLSNWVNLVGHPTNSVSPLSLLVLF